MSPSPPSSGACGAEMRGEPGDPPREDGGFAASPPPRAELPRDVVAKGPLKGAAGCLLRAWASGPLGASVPHWGQDPAWPWSRLSPHILQPRPRTPQPPRLESTPTLRGAWGAERVASSE